MKLTAFALLVFSLHVSARAVSQTITFSGRDVPLETIFGAIEKQTGFVVFYDYRQITGARPVTLEAKNEPLKTFLEACFKDQPFGFAIEDQTISITHKGSVLLAPAAAPDTVVRPAGELTGVVMGENSQVLTGASVEIKSSRKGTNTDVHGRFVIRSVPPGTVLLVTMVGYNLLEYKVGGTDKNIFLHMVLASNILDQTVVQAYGTSTQRYETGNIATVSGKDIEQVPVMNPLLALQGQVAGLAINPGQNAFPSGIVKVELQGRNTVNQALPSDPLYVVDGVPLSVLTVDPAGNTSYPNGSQGFSQTNFLGPAGGQSPLFGLSPSDIESISVLKDADATSIYGARAANGVVMITTKHGKPGKTKLDLTASSGTSWVTRRWPLLNTTQYLQMRREAYSQDGLTPDIYSAPDLLTWDTTRNVNWQNYLWGHQGKVTQVGGALSGGEGRTNFRLGVNYNQQDDITTYSGGNRSLNTTLNLNHSSQDQRLSIGIQLIYRYTKVNMITLPGQATLPPDTPPMYDAGGTLNWTGWGVLNYDYPYATLLQPYSSSSNFINANTTIGYTIIKGLKAAVTAGYNNNLNSQQEQFPIASMNPQYNPTGALDLGKNFNTNFLIQPGLQYTGFVGPGKLNVQINGSFQSTSTEGDQTSASGFTNDLLLRSVTNAPTTRVVEDYGQQKYVSVFSTINYNLYNKYILNLNGRRDGSSLFAPNDRFGNFGDVGAAWILSEEKWVKRVLPSFVSFVKLRGSYGTTGNDGGTPYQYLSQWSAQYTFPYNGITSYQPTAFANPNLHWAVKRSTDVSLNLGFVKDRINLLIDHYVHRTSNQLAAEPLAAFTGFGTVEANVPADVQDAGWEVTLNAKLISNKNFNWTAAWNIGINSNKLLGFPNLANSAYATRYKVGKPLNVVYLFKYTGVDPKTGKYTYYDYNHDGVITFNYAVPAGTGNDDRGVTQSLNPPYQGGFQTTFSYRSWSLSLAGTYVKQVAENANSSVIAGNLGNISLEEYHHTWHQPGDQARYAKYTTGGDQTYYDFDASTGIYTNASYVRLTSAVLSWAMPAAAVKKAHMSALTFNIYTNNLFTITKYKGLDPQTASFGSMPPARIVTAGLTASF